MVVQIIFFITMYPMLFILYFVMRGVGDAKNGYSFGLRMKAEWMKDTKVQEIVQQYRKELLQTTLIFAVIPLVTFLIPYFSISFTIWMIWLLAAIAVPAIPYVGANKKLRELKRARDWAKSSGATNRTEIKQAGKVRRVRVIPFLVPTIISAAAAVLSVIEFNGKGFAGLSAIVITFALCTPLFYGVAVWMDRQKIEVISDDSDVNLNYARAKKNIWKNVWLMIAWVNTVFTIFIAMTLHVDEMAVGGILIGTIIYTIIVVGVLFWGWKRQQAVDARYQAKRDAAEQEDDDEYWLWGMFYYNKNDKHVMVNQRAGMGTTMNMATPVGMGMTIFGVGLLIFIVPLSCLWLILEEFTPIQLAVENQVLVAEHLHVEYEIPLEDIETVTLVEETPAWSKVSGTGMDALCKGTFHIRNEGDCEVLLNPQNAIFLQIKTADETYYMSTPEDELTKALYKELLSGAEVQ